MFSRTEQFLTWIIGLSPLISVLPAKSVVSLMYLQILASRNAIHQSPCDRLGSRGAIWNSNSKTRVLRERAGGQMIFRTSSFRCCDMLWLIAQKPWICESVETTWHRANFTKGRVPCLTGFQPVQEQGSVRLWRWRFAPVKDEDLLLQLSSTWLHVRIDGVKRCHIIQSLAAMQMLGSSVVASLTVIVLAARPVQVYKTRVWWYQRIKSEWYEKYSEMKTNYIQLLSWLCKTSAVRLRASWPPVPPEILGCIGASMPALCSGGWFSSGSFKKWYSKTHVIWGKVLIKPDKVRSCKFKNNDVIPPVFSQIWCLNVWHYWQKIEPPWAPKLASIDGLHGILQANIIPESVSSSTGHRRRCRTPRCFLLVKIQRCFPRFGLLLQTFYIGKGKTTKQGLLRD